MGAEEVGAGPPVVHKLGESSSNAIRENGRMGTDEGELEVEAYKSWRAREEEILRSLEEFTSNMKETQARTLARILTLNADTAYLRQFELGGATDVQTFRDRVPVSNYDSIRPFVQRIIAGETEPLLSGTPVVEIFASSGTSGAEPKLFPVTQEDKILRYKSWLKQRPIMNRNIPGMEKGKCMYFYFVQKGKQMGSLPCWSAVTGFIYSDEFRNRPFDPSFRLTSPDEVLKSYDYIESCYCHFICGLYQREEVLRLGALFSSSLVRIMHDLETWWPEICEDLANGTLSKARVQSEEVRGAMQPYLRADPALAELVRRECSKETWKGIITRLWPNIRVIDVICTGTMEHYNPTINHLAGSVPLVCTQVYGASEGYFGYNMNTMCEPAKISYTIDSSAAYFEFIPICQEETDETMVERPVLDLASIQQGQEYEILTTTISGLCRFQVGDIVKVVGFYNQTPSVQVVGRKCVMQSVDTEKVEEQTFQHGAKRCADIIQEGLNLTLEDYTSTVDVTATPGHYVVYLELAQNEKSMEQVPTHLLERCCTTFESSFSRVYRKKRIEGRIGALEVRIVRPGTFILLAALICSLGTSPSQYKTPKSVSLAKTAYLDLLNAGVTQRHSSTALPSLSH